jgi:immune inhibitor A
MNTNKSKYLGQAGLVAIGLVFAMTLGAVAMPPHPDVITAVANGKLAPSYYLVNRADLHNRGVCTPDSFFKSIRRPMGAALSPTAAPFRILAILVKYSDRNSSVATAFFDSLVFDTAGATVRDYFNEISGAQIDLVTVNLPSTLGWRTAPQTYAYYCNGQNGLGSYPNNCQKMVEDLVDQVDPLVDFSQYDNDGDNYVDVLLVIHTGSGAERTGSANDIWSHKWGINARLKDGVYISSYTTQPEYWTTPGDMTIGVYAHELGHGFGLPDLYDTDNSSKGIGRWCLMAYGGWNGTNGASPAYPCAWSRIQMGFAAYTNVSGVLINQAIPNIEQGGPIYRLWTAGAIGQQYYLVENRQRLGYDVGLPNSGLLIWHIDDGKASLQNPNDQEWYPGLPAASHACVALEQSDGLYELEHNVDAGDAGDPFPGSSSNTSFSDGTTPSANAYAGTTTSIQVANISASSATMHADLVVTITAGTDDPGGGTLPTGPQLAQNYPNPFNPSTTIKFNIPTDGPVKLEIYNTLGQKVRTLLDGPLPWGETEVVWDARDDDGRPVTTGVYLYRLTADGQTQTRKMVMLK